MMQTYQGEKELVYERPGPIERRQVKARGQVDQVSRHGVGLEWRAAGDDCMDASPEAGNDPSICRLHLQGEL